MADINLSSRYALINRASSGSSRSLSSTSLNASLIIVPPNSSDSQSWYFTSTSTRDYYRLHTTQKGDFNALDVDNYYGQNSIDLHFYAVQERSGQYWRVRTQSDGSVKLSNNFTGPDIYLDIDETNLQPTLRALDSPGQRWTLSSPGSSATARVADVTSSSSSTLATITSTGSATASSGNQQSTCTAGCLVTDISPSSKKLSSGVIGGIAAGGAIVLALVAIGSYLLWRKRRNRTHAMEVPLKPLNPNPILNA